MRQVRTQVARQIQPAFPKKERGIVQGSHIRTKARGSLFKKKITFEITISQDFPLAKSAVSSFYGAESGGNCSVDL